MLGSLLSLSSLFFCAFFSFAWEWPRSKSEEETFPSLNQTGESSSLDLNLGYFQKFLIICVGGRAQNSGWCSGALDKASPSHIVTLLLLWGTLSCKHKSSTSKAKDKRSPRRWWVMETILLCWGSVSCRHKSSTKPRTRQADRRRSSHHPSSITQDPPGPNLKRKPSPVWIRLGRVPL